MEKIPGITREEEEERLACVLKIAQENLEKKQGEVKGLQEELHELLETYGTKDKEALALWNNTVARLEETKNELARSEKARKKPYFGRIDFTAEQSKGPECCYIGRVGIARDVTNLEVIDWRAPIAGVYYENAVGRCSYQVKNEGSYEIELTRKRTYEIEQDELRDFYDSDVVANDELLTKYLAKNKKAVLGEIIATIQQEQNAIIRKSPKRNILVQGAAGSGKTTVAMHRISYILYNYAAEYRPEDFYIVGSNRILLNYITSVLPDLDVYGIRQMTMEQLFVRLLYEDWDEKKMSVKPPEKGAEEKGRIAWFHALEAYCAALEWRAVPREDIAINRADYGIYGVKETHPAAARSKLLLPRDAIETYIRENPQISIQNKIRMLNERIAAKVNNEIAGKEVGYTPEEKKELCRKFRFHFGPKRWKKPIFEIYEDFLAQQEREDKPVPYEKDRFDVYDLAALAYLYKRVKETEEIREASHVVIDEAQDFGMTAYAALKYCMRGGCTFTIMGDVSQNIHFGSGLNDWEELREHFLTGPFDSFEILRKSYRNTVEISRFATDILRHGSFPVYPSEPIVRHGNSVRVERCADEAELMEETAAAIKKWQRRGLETIAVVCRDEAQAKNAVRRLGKTVELSDGTLAGAEFGSGVMVLPVAYTKGLEFDAVVILNPDREAYPSDNGHAKLLYVAVTRALHELAVLHTGGLTGLIEDPVPERQEAQKTAERAEEQKTAGQTEEPKTTERAEEPKTAERAEVQRARGAQEKEKTRERPSAWEAPEIGFSRADIGPKKIEPAKEQRPKDKMPAALTRPGEPETARKKNLSPYRFGEMPDQSSLRVAGHAKADTAVRWMKKTPDGAELASAYGTLRIVPLAPEIVRVSFRKGAAPVFTDCGEIALSPGQVKWRCRETREAVELATERLLVRVEKKSGAVKFFTADGKLLLSEREKEPRLIEQGGKDQTWMFFDWAKDEKIWAKGALAGDLLKLNLSARYISFGGRSIKIPCVLSEKGYGLAFPAEDTVMCCAIPMYGPYVTAEKTAQTDYCFLYGGGVPESEALYKIFAGGEKRLS